MSFKYFEYKEEDWAVNYDWKPCEWDTYGATILLDGYNLNTGQRLHIVDLPGQGYPVTFANALVVTDRYFKENFKQFYYVKKIGELK